MIDDMRLPTPLSASTAALQCNVAVSTIYRWVASGFLPCAKRLRGRGFTVLARDVEACKLVPRIGSPPRTPKRPWMNNAKRRYRERRAAMSEKELDEQRARMREYYYARKFRQGV